MIFRAVQQCAIGAALFAASCNYPAFEYRNPIACTSGEVGSCGAGKKCALTNVDTGEFACVNDGTKKVWQSCSRDADCVDGTLCDPKYGACKPRCESASDCEFQATRDQTPFTVKGSCIEAQRPNGSVISKKVLHCTSGCEPIGASPCDANANVTCIDRTGEGFDCAKSKNVGEGIACTSEVDCAPGRVCIVITETPLSAKCARWCDVPGQDSPSCPSIASKCVFFEPPLTFQEKPYGTCVEP